METLGNSAPRKINPKKITQGQSVVKYLSCKRTEKNFKAAREKGQQRSHKNDNCLLNGNVENGNYIYMGLYI